MTVLLVFQPVDGSSVLLDGRRTRTDEEPRESGFDDAARITNIVTGGDAIAKAAGSRRVEDGFAADDFADVLAMSGLPNSRRAEVCLQV